MLVCMEQVVLWSFPLEELEDVDCVLIIIDSEKVTTMRELDLIDTLDVERMVGRDCIRSLWVHGTISDHDGVELDSIRVRSHYVMPRRM